MTLCAAAIPDADCLGATYVNAAFTPLPPLPALPPPSPVPTEEDEEQEILRIAQVPFQLVDSCDETYLEVSVPSSSWLQLHRSITIAQHNYSS